ncbi:hypothetical protein D3C84_1202720 [compost metagenome]
MVLGLCLMLVWMVQMQRSVTFVRGTQAMACAQVFNGCGQPLVSVQQLFGR